MTKSKAFYPAGLEYGVALDTRLPVTEGIKEIVISLVIAMILVIMELFVFLHGWRATLILIVAVPLSLLGTFAFFSLLGFSINPIALMGPGIGVGRSSCQFLPVGPLLNR